MREDLRVVDQVHRGERTFVVGDSIGLEFYHLNEQEFFLLKAFNGTHSFDDIKRQFEEAFAPYQIRYQEIQQYLLDFHSKSLLASGTADQGRHLSALGRKKTLKKKLAGARNLLAIRFRGINPDRIFRLITPWTSWFFSTPVVVLNCLFMLAALLWLGTHYDEFAQRLPTLSSFFVGQNLVMLFTVMIVMKVLHEFGHGIVFTKYGGRCHELGVMLLIFLPTLYVNTSDSWQMKNKYHRAAIAAAGVYVELFLAAVATFCWWFAKTSLAQNLALNVMLLGSVSAVLFNGNPLLRFDGYFCLSDLIEIPNLRQRSGQFIRNVFLWFGLGVQEGDEFLLPWQTKAWLAFYLFASFFYRVFLLYCIAFIVVGYLTPLGLETLAKGFSLFLMASLVFVPSMSLFRYFRVPGRVQKVNTKRAFVTGGITLALLFVVVAVPFPDRVVCDFVVEPTDAEQVYVRHQAQLEEIHVEPRQWVEKDALIATLRNLEIELEVADLEGQLTELQTQQKMAILSRHSSSQAAEKLGVVREQIETVEGRLRELGKIVDGMELRAPREGNVIPEWRDTMAKASPDMLDSWDGWALDKENLHATFERGEVVCSVGDLSVPEARLMIDQADIESVEAGLDVQLLLESRSGKTFSGKIEKVSTSNTDRVLRQIAQNYGGSVETKNTRSAQLRDLQDDKSSMPADAVFEAIVPLPASDSPLEAGLRGTARIQVGQRTLASKFYRFLHKTFRFDM